MLGGVVCLDGWVWVGGGIVGRVCSWRGIAVEIQQLIYQYKVLYYEIKEREREKKIFLFFFSIRQFKCCSLLVPFQDVLIN